MINPTPNAARWYALAERYFQARELPIEEMRVIDCWPVEAGPPVNGRAYSRETQTGVYWNGSAWEYYRGHALGTEPRPQDLCALTGSGFYRVQDVPYTEAQILASDGYLEPQYSAQRLGPAEHTSHFHKVLEHKCERADDSNDMQRRDDGTQRYRPARIVWQEFLLECIVCGFKDKHTHAEVLRETGYQDHALALAPSDCCAPVFFEAYTDDFTMRPRRQRVVKIEIDGAPAVYFDEQATRAITRALRGVPILNCFNGVFDEYPHKNGFQRREDI